MAKYDFGDFGGTDVGAVVEEKWQYPTIGYSAGSGTFYIDTEEHEGKMPCPISILAVRECKEVTDSDGITHRYPLRTPKKNMVLGDVQSRLQAIFYLWSGDEREGLHVFGARAWTTRAAFVNPRGGEYRHKNYDNPGIWFQLQDHCALVKAENGVLTTPMLWKINLVTGPEFKAQSWSNPKQSSKARPILLGGEPEFVGGEAANMLVQLYQDEEISAWVEEWKKHEVVEAEADDAGPATFTAEEVDAVPF